MFSRLSPLLNRLEVIQRQPRKFLLLWILFTLIVGMVYSFILGDQLRFLPDESDYVQLAQNLAQGKGYSLDGVNPSAYRAPGFPAVLAVVNKLGGGVVAFRLVNFVFLAVSVALLYALVRRQGLLGATAPLLLLVYPVTVYTAGALYPQTMAGMLFLWVLYFLAHPGLDFWRALLGGGAFALLLLTVPTFAFALPVITVWWLWNRQPDLGKILIGVSLPLILLVGAWTIRNERAFGTLFFVAANSGENLLLGNSNATTPNGGAGVDITHFRQEASRLGEVERDNYFRQQALAWIGANPNRAFQLYLLKLINFFNYRNELVTQSEGSQLKDLLMFVTYGFLLVLSILRLTQIRKKRLNAFEVLLVSLYLSSALVSAIFFTRIRFRLPFDLLLVLFVSMFLENLSLQILIKSKNEIPVTASSVEIPTGKTS